MTARLHLPFRLLSLLAAGGLALASQTASAQTEEDPEPEVSDQGPRLSDPEPEVSDEGPRLSDPEPEVSDEGSPDEADPEPEVSNEGPDVWDRILSFHVTGGIDTPFGVAGGAVEVTPFRYLSIYAGGGIGRSGGRVAGGIRGQAPIGNAAVGIMLGVHGSPLDWESRGRTNESLHTSRHWDFALFWHGGITAEYRWDFGLFGRLAFGVEALLTPDSPDACTIGADGDRSECGGLADGLAKPVRGWAGLTIGYALDL